VVWVLTLWSLSPLFPMNLSSILVWNARGLNQVDRSNSVRDVICSVNAPIVCLQETKVSALSQHLFQSVFSTAYDKFVDLPAIVTGGGGGGCLGLFVKDTSAKI